MPRIHDLTRLLDEATALLRQASGNDAIISERDAEKLFLTLEGPRRAFVEELFRFARSLEQPGGRLTRSDLEAAAERVRAEMLPELEVLPQELTKSEAERLAARGEAHARLAQRWKAWLIEPPRLDAAQLAAQLREALPGLLFNAFYPDQAHVQAHALPTPPRWPELADLRDALYLSSDPHLANINAYLENPVQDSPADDFLEAFVAVQSPDNQARAARVAASLRQHLRTMRYFEFSSNYYEASTYLVGGLAADGLLLLTQTYFWS